MAGDRSCHFDALVSFEIARYSYTKVIPAHSREYEQLLGNFVINIFIFVRLTQNESMGIFVELPLFRYDQQV